MSELIAITRIHLKALIDAATAASGGNAEVIPITSTSQPDPRTVGKQHRLSRLVGYRMYVRQRIA